MASLRVAEERSGIAPDYEPGLTHTDMQSPAGQHLFFMLYEDECFQEALLQVLHAGFEEACGGLILSYPGISG